jgi:excisionase family DNA binding protein
MSVVLLTRNRLYTPEQVADILQVDVSTVYGFIKDKKLLASRLGRVYRIPFEAVEELVLMGVDREAYRKFLLFKIRGVRQRQEAMSPEEVEKDAIEAVQAIRHGKAG